MHEFFKPWRRKLGVVALGLACLFIAGRVRGQKSEDVIMFGSGKGKTIHTLAFSRDGIKWQKDSSDHEYTWLTGWTSNSIEDTGRHDPTKGYSDPQEVEWRWVLCGIECGEFHDQIYPTNRVSWWLVSYWSIVIPLTLVSAYLLLSKPRAKPKQTVNHA